jgi:hypothetical protein
VTEKELKAVQMLLKRTKDRRNGIEPALLSSRPGHERDQADDLKSTNWRRLSSCIRLFPMPVGECPIYGELIRLPLDNLCGVRLVIVNHDRPVCR